MQLKKTKVGQWIRFTACFDPVLNYYRISHFKPIPENFAVNGGNLRSFKVVRLNADDSDESKFAVKHSFNCLLLCMIKRFSSKYPLSTIPAVND